MNVAHIYVIYLPFRVFVHGVTDTVSECELKR